MSSPTTSPVIERAYLNSPASEPNAEPKPQLASEPVTELEGVRKVREYLAAAEAAFHQRDKGFWDDTPPPLPFDFAELGWKISAVVADSEREAEAYREVAKVLAARMATLSMQRSEAILACHALVFAHDCLQKSQAIEDKSPLEFFAPALAKAQKVLGSVAP